MLIAAAGIAFTISISTAAGAESLLGPSVFVHSPSNATGVSHATLSGIACIGDSCVAVGTYENAARAGVPMIAAATSGVWSRSSQVTLPSNHAGVYSASTLAGVDCPAVHSCVAVGSYELASKSVLPLVLTQSAGTWDPGSTITLPSSEATNELARLTSVSCVVPGSCTAVGSFTDQHGAAGLLAVSSSSGIWAAARRVALPAGVGTVPHALGSVQLDAVSCSDATDCVAVGSFLDDTGGYLPLRAVESHGIWREAVAVPVPRRSDVVGSAALDSVSCSAATSCLAVGYDTNSAGHQAPIVERESKGSWGPTTPIGFPKANPPAVGGALAGVACTARSCAAVGTEVSSARTATAVVLVLTAGRWQPFQAVDSLPPTSPDRSASELDDISCPSPNACIGVGDLRSVTATGGTASSAAMATRVTPLRPVVDPAPPNHVTARPGPGHLTVSWTPSGDGGTPISSFSATADPGNASCTSKSTSCVLSELHDGTGYVVVVTATNVRGTSIASAPSRRAVPGTAPTPPAGFVVTRGRGRATLRWRPSTGSPGDPVTSYMAWAFAGSTQAGTCSTTTTSCTILGLARGVVYTVWVVAYNPVGPSLPSSTRRFVSQ